MLWTGGSHCLSPRKKKKKKKNLPYLSGLVGMWPDLEIYPLQGTLCRYVNTRVGKVDRPGGALIDVFSLKKAARGGFTSGTFLRR